MPNQTDRLKFLNADMDSLEGSQLRTFHNGHLGGAHEQLFYIRNEDPAVYYTNVKLTPVYVPDGQDLANKTELTWSVKLMYGSRRPTEEEWDLVSNGEILTLPNIGMQYLADTTTNYPVWVRVFCPGGENAKISSDFSFKLTYFTKITE